MNRMFRMGLTLFAAGAIGAWVTPVAHAQVEAPGSPSNYSDKIALSGTATISSDNDGGCGDPADVNQTPPVGNPANPDGSPAVDFIGGCGSFQFTSSACQAISDAESSATQQEHGSCNVTATGSFTNVRCGTGTASGTFNLTSAAENVSGSFTITFTATVGTITGSFTAEAPGPGSTESDSDPLDTFSGTVNLGPGTTVPDAGDCAHTFSITSQITAVG